MLINVENAILNEHILLEIYLLYEPKSCLECRDWKDHFSGFFMCFISLVKLSL